MELVAAVHLFHEKVVAIDTRSIVFILTQWCCYIVGDVNS